VRIELLGGFRLFRGHRAVDIPRGSAQLLAFVALHRLAVDRAVVAGTFWPNASERRAYAALRSALARLEGANRAVLRISPLTLSLAKGVAVDFLEAQALAHRLLEPAIPSAEPDFSATAIATLSQDLLPNWYDDWAILEAEDWRQLRLHALEVITAGLTAAGRLGNAAAAAAAVIHADPLRESAHTAMIRVHLAEGNRSEAFRAFERFRRLLRTELDIEPSPKLRALVMAPWQPSGVTRR
jgi:SARP family transcriptional regulator, regulator of embCAB operon